MPIKGVTDQPAKFPRVGELRKGAPKEKNKPGEDLEYFRFTSDEPDIEERFYEFYGEKPRAIPVTMPFSTAEEAFEAWLEEWGKGGIKRRCDGETQHLWQDEKGHYHGKEIDDRTPECVQGEGKCDCQRNGRLALWLTALKKFGVVTLLTSSVHDIRNLKGCLDRCEQIARSMGKDLSGIPMVLKRKPKKISTPSGPNGTRVRREKWLCFIEPAEEWVQLQIEEAKARQMQRELTASQPHQIEDGQDQLEPPSDVDPDTGEVEVMSVEDEQQSSHQDFNPVDDVEAILKQAPDSMIRDAAIESREFGFAADMRSLRLSFTELLVGYQLDSYNDLEDGDAEYVANSLEFFRDFLDDHGADSEQSHIMFAKWVVSELPNNEQELLQKAEYLRPIANKFIEAHSG